MAFQTPGLDAWMRDAEPSLARCRAECKGDDAPARLGTLTTWAGWADQELAQLRAENARLQAEAEAAKAALAKQGVRDDFEEDAETARRQRQGAFADAWEFGDLSPAFIGRHVHE